MIPWIIGYVIIGSLFTAWFIPFGVEMQNARAVWWHFPACILGWPLFMLAIMIGGIIHFTKRE